MEDQWPMFVWAACVALAIAAGGWTATNRREARPSLPIEHVAGATLLGYFGWEVLINLPGSVMGFWSLTAGLGEVRGVEGHQAFVVAQGAFVVAAGLAIYGIARRRPWGAVLGIGLTLSIVAWRVLSLITTFILFGESFAGDTYLTLVSTSIGLYAVPALVAAVLLARPLLARTTPPPVDASRPEWRQEPTTAER